MTLLLLACFAAQDAATLIDRLGDARAEVREEAQQALVRMGDPAIPALQEAVKDRDASGEVRMRASAALRVIRDRKEIGRFVPPPRRASIDVEAAPLSAVLEALSRQTGVRMDASGVDATVPVTLRLADAPLLQVLDRLCEGRPDRTYEARDDGSLRFLAKPHAPMPAGYVGPFRVRVTSVTATRRSTFPGKTVTADLELAIDGEPGVPPGTDHRFTVEEAKDGDGRELRVAPRGRGTSARFDGGGMVVVLGNAGEKDRGTAWTLSRLDPDAKTFSILGEATVTFPLSPREVRFDGTPEAGDTRTLGPFEIRLERAGPDCKFKVTRTGDDPAAAGGPGLASRIDPGSVVAVDGNGKEHRPATFGPSNQIESVIALDGKGGWVVGPDGTLTSRAALSSMSFSARFGSLPGGLKELRFTLADRVHQQALPFEIRGIELP